MSVLMHASDQWASRPADQRFGSLADLDAAVRKYRDMSVEVKGVDLRTLTAAVGVGPDDAAPKLLTPGEQYPIEMTREPVIYTPTGEPARFTHYSFGQFCRRLGAKKEQGVPAGYLRSLPVPLAVANLNQAIRNTESGNDNLLFARNGGLRLRCDVSGEYERIWNADVTERLIRLSADHPEWQPAPEAFDGSRGLYASDKDMFAFMVDNDRRIFESLPGGGLSRGFFLWNSEVGDAAFNVLTFLYEYVCGNHRVWGAAGLKQIRVPHIGNANDRAFKQLSVELTKYAEASDKDDETKIATLRATVLGGTKQEVLDAVFKALPEIPRKVHEAAYGIAVAEEAKYGNPHSVWGYTGGLTQIARDKQNADERVRLDRAAFKLAEMKW